MWVANLGRKEATNYPGIRSEKGNISQKNRSGTNISRIMYQVVVVALIEC